MKRGGYNAFFAVGLVLAPACAAEAAEVMVDIAPSVLPSTTSLAPEITTPTTAPTTTVPETNTTTSFDPPIAPPTPEQLIARQSLDEIVARLGEIGLKPAEIQLPNIAALGDVVITYMDDPRCGLQLSALYDLQYSPPLNLNVQLFGPLKFFTDSETVYNTAIGASNPILDHGVNVSGYPSSSIDESLSNVTQMMAQYCPR